MSGFFLQAVEYTVFCVLNLCLDPLCKLDVFSPIKSIKSKFLTEIGEEKIRLAFPLVTHIIG